MKNEETGIYEGPCITHLDPNFSYQLIENIINEMSKDGVSSNDISEFCASIQRHVHLTTKEFFVIKNQYSKK
jgi:hypothetical protein